LELSQFERLGTGQREMFGEKAINQQKYLLQTQRGERFSQ
jgi:hypothetical protein